MTETQTLVHSLSKSNLKATPWKQGNLFKREKGIIRTTWKERFVILFEGSLFYYQANTDLTPRGVVHLMNCKIEEAQEKKTKRKFCMQLQNGKEELIFACSDELDLKNWLISITDNLNRPPSPPPSKEFKITKGKSSSVYVTAKIAETITSMGVGGKIIREILSDDAVVIIDSLKNFLAQKLGAEKASALEKQAIGIAVKIALLHKDKRINTADLLAVTVPIRLLVSKVIDGYEIPFTFSAAEAAADMRQVQAAFEKIMKPVLTDKTIQKFRGMFDVFADEELIEDFFEKKKWRECEIIATRLRDLWDNGRF